MPSRPTRSQARLFQALIAKLEPSLRKAFMDAANDWRQGVDFRALLDALGRQDVDAAISALNLDAAAFNTFAQVKTAAYVEGGTAAVKTINISAKEKIKVRFDMSNPSAERWIAENVGDRVRNITAEQVEAVRTTILSGYSEGQGPETIARDIAGRVSNGSRQGGILGLSKPQSEYVANMRTRLRSGNPAELRKVLESMTLRDKRSDPTIRKAIKTGKPLTEAQIELMAQRYSDKLLAKRGRDIARTETGQAVLSGRVEEWKQAAEKLGYDDRDIEKTWIHNYGVLGGYRDAHRAMNNRTVVGLDTPFILPNGVAKQHPLDGEGGAAQDANCTCNMTIRLNRARGL